MLEAIFNILRETPSLKGRQIAKKSGLNKSEVNSFLHRNQSIFTKNDEHEWNIIQKAAIEINFAGGWIDETQFESAIGMLKYNQQAEKVTFKFGEGCKFLLIALSRFLALANQSVGEGKQVIIDITSCLKTYSYFNRNGFFDFLDTNVVCLPERPLMSAAQTYRDNSDTLVELGAIALSSSDNKDLIIRLGDRFVEHSAENYLQACKTVFSELVGNVTDHSQSKTPGLVGLQVYKGKQKHIQTIISDSGLGIAATLRTTLKKEHPDLYKQYSIQSVKSDIELVCETVMSGEISRFGKGRGLGFKSSREQASKEKVFIIIRQESFAISLEYFKGQLQDIFVMKDLVPLSGTHICFDFYIDCF
ncbi:ATP-binding protein [Budvicia aquatica]|uniref:ATP-binding protein n=1 Tax=Budvicia aquatica TaxID=82979 RepID=UPI00208986EB|nr:ATP-binding protein [Budvicia aquatica]GKX50322.1 hypothetical protein SOASR029_06310 [Budvicia aquatica]